VTAVLVSGTAYGCTSNAPTSHMESRGSCFPPISQAYAFLGLLLSSHRHEGLLRTFLGCHLDSLCALDCEAYDEAMCEAAVQ